MLWKEETLFFNGDEYFQSLYAAWKLATQTIELEAYIFDDDPIGNEVSKELCRAAKRGVSVRLLVDGIGASGWWQTKAQELEQSGVSIRVFHPVIMTEIWRKLMVDLKLKLPGQKPHRSLVLRRLNVRNHRKTCLVDSKIAYIGSINVSQTHSFRFSGNAAWRDIAVRLEGTYISELTEAFNHTWNRSHKIRQRNKSKIRFTFSRRIDYRESPVSLNYTRRLRRQSRTKFKHLIKAAQERIWISNAYLAPPSNIARLLRQAAHRGVDVRILIPRQSDVWFMPFISRAYYRTLLKSGIKIYEYLPRFLHAKSIIVDNQAMIGTTNLNRRSFLHDLEVDVRIDRPESLDRLSTQYLEELKSSVIATKYSTIVGSRIGRILNYFLRYWV